MTQFGARQCGVAKLRCLENSGTAMQARVAIMREPETAMELDRTVRCKTVDTIRSSFGHADCNLT